MLFTMTTAINNTLRDKDDLAISSSKGQTDLIGLLALVLVIQKGNNHYSQTNVERSIPLQQRRLKKDSETIGF